MVVSFLKKLMGGRDSAPAALNSTHDGVPILQEVQLAVFVLLIEMSGKDQHIDDAEVAIIVEVGKRHFGFSESDAVALVEKALQARKDAGKIDNFVRKLNEVYSERQKRTLMAIIWKIVMADGEIDEFERKFAVQIRYRLQLDEMSAEDAKRMATEGVV
jgi:uncharacterized tellurite resistance protein B-like protein